MPHHPTGRLPQLHIANFGYAFFVLAGPTLMLEERGERGEATNGERGAAAPTRGPPLLRGRSSTALGHPLPLLLRHRHQRWFRRGEEGSTTGRGGRHRGARRSPCLCDGLRSMPAAPPELAGHAAPRFVTTSTRCRLRHRRKRRRGGEGRQGERSSCAAPRSTPVGPRRPRRPLICSSERGEMRLRPARGERR